MNKPKFIASLGLFNMAIFVLVTLFLPRKGSFGWSGPVSYFINSRDDWHIAFGVLVGTVLLSWGLYLAIASFQQSPPGNDDRSDRESS